MEFTLMGSDTYDDGFLLKTFLTIDERVLVVL